MDDALLMRGLQRFRHLAGDCQRFVERYRPIRDSLGERWAFDQFHDEIIWPDIVERADVRVIQRGHGARLPLEALAELGVANLDGDPAVEPRVASLVHFAHATRPDWPEDLVRT
jgi:hypothetical protein